MDSKTDTKKQDCGSLAADVGYVFHYYRYHRLYTEEHDTLTEALESAMSGESEGSLSSHKITRGDKVVWDSSMGYIFKFAEQNGVST